ncbi:GNAT acetyltransferase 2-domain-containing protein [Cokeromyces recurvatus]|uniref:GNAT acetyltransferase 2-domain-containing protein n=1 Tax=Cokeromyces recurvatus TaxID=90255 RepID=UPI00221E7862|nr:GNAT acetyltransferase 2-domain-containing protein [Cokeromyces recurvatus]KAI7905335.1 GNAT acetyltransferase 2-domain-containing protein [Cokeromyces recurvatus]
MVKKVVDSRVHTLIKNCVQTKHRSFFVIVGDKGKDQVVNLHWLLSQAQVTSRPSVLWCYKKELGFTSHRKKREKKIKNDIKRGIRDVNKEDPFELFITVTNIRYAYYKETQNILGNTYGMCILQDFEAITPNTLARTIETVEGGGMVVLLLKSMSSLKQLYTMTMDVHSRYRTEAHNDIVARFNERFILSLGSCETCLVVDDELNVLPISMGKNVKPLAIKSSDEKTPEEIELAELKESLADTEPVASLVKGARTLDQAKAVLTFIEAISEKSLRSTVTLTASRGRGKSAALGIAMASAVAYGYSNIFVTSPSPENLKTLFEFVFKTFDALGYEEHLDYDIVQSTNPDFNKAIVRVNIFKQHRQTIQYIQPQDAHVLGQAELVVIDEAAAIPLPLVRKLLGPYLVFMASTINGYEGTGRSLSLKLIQQLREQSRGIPIKDKDDTEGIVVNRDLQAKKVEGSDGALTGRSLKEVTLDEPIRYAPNDPVEKWLNKLLCLDATVISKNIQGCPHPSECELYYVNRDTLFSYHPVSETFLQRMMALYVSSHYKNSPNDLQLMSDAPAHHLFVLLPPVNAKTNSLPDPLVVIQVCLEGEISRQTVVNSLSRGQRPSGDMIPWLISQQYQDDDFASLSGARVVRIATHPDYAKMGYGSRALELLTNFYQGKANDLSESTQPLDDESLPLVEDYELENANLKTDQVKVRDPSKMPPLLTKLDEKRAQRLDYLGVSYGLTASLHKFWKRAGFVPLYVRQTANDLTGEHSCVMIKALTDTEDSRVANAAWLDAFARDFSKRFIHLLSYNFREFTAVNALNILDGAKQGQDSEQEETRELDKESLSHLFSPYDLKRLESYSNNMLDYHVILDMIPTIAELYFRGEMPTDIKLSGVQSAILLGIGLQRKSVDQLQDELNLASNQVLALFIKIVRKISNYFAKVETKAYEETVPALKKSDKTSHKRDAADDEAWKPVKEDLEADLEKAGEEVLDELKAKQRELIDSLDLSKYAIGGTDEEWAAAGDRVKALTSGKKSGMSSVVSIKNENSSKKRKLESAQQISEKEQKRLMGKVKLSKKAKSS